VIGGKVLGARFRYPQRAAEGTAYLDWFRHSGFQTVREPRTVNEGETDILFAETAIIADHGFRSDPEVTSELEEFFGLPVINLRLVDPRFYHLDTALCVLGGRVAATIEAAAFEPVPVDLPELLKAGGGRKCCTLELRH
jgi:N-dimethylarginine dimethylaminohydrolase